MPSGYRERKHTLHLQRRHARTLHSLYAELFFTMILVPLTRRIMAQAAAGRDPATLSFARCLRWVQTAALSAMGRPPDEWPGLYDQLLQQVRRCPIDTRPGRQFQRHKQKRRAASRAKRLAAMKETEL